MSLSQNDTTCTCCWKQVRKQQEGNIPVSYIVQQDSMHTHAAVSTYASFELIVCSRPSKMHIALVLAWYACTAADSVA